VQKVYLKDRCGYIKTHLREPMCNLTEQLLNVLKKIRLKQLTNTRVANGSKF